MENVNGVVIQAHRLRVGDCLKLFAVSRSTWYRGMGKFFPHPDGRDPRPFWKASTIKVFLEGHP